MAMRAFAMKLETAKIRRTTRNSGIANDTGSDLGCAVSWRTTGSSGVGWRQARIRDRRTSRLLTIARIAQAAAVGLSQREATASASDRLTWATKASATSR